MKIITKKMKKKWRLYLFCFMELNKWARKLMIIEEAIIAIEKNIPFVRKIKLLRIEDVYWIIDIWPNLKCKFERPTMILLWFKISINGRWYKYASGLYTSLFAINKQIIIELSIINFKKL